MPAPGGPRAPVPVRAGPLERAAGDGGAGIKRGLRELGGGMGGSGGRRMRGDPAAAFKGVVKGWRAQLSQVGTG